MLIKLDDRQMDYLRRLLTSEDEGNAEFVAGVGYRHLDGDIDCAHDLLTKLADVGPVNVSLVETGSSFDNLFVFTDERNAERFRKIRMYSDEDIAHGSTPVLNSSFICTAARSEDIAEHFAEHGIESLDDVPDDQILACIDDMPTDPGSDEGQSPDSEDMIAWTRRWVQRWKVTPPFGNEVQG